MFLKNAIKSSEEMIKNVQNSCVGAPPFPSL